MIRKSIASASFFFLVGFLCAPQVSAQSSSNLTDIVTCDPAFNGAIPHPINCEKFFVCTAGEPSLHDCALDLHYDLLLNGCNFAEQVLCGNRTRPEDGSTTEEIESETEAETVTGQPASTGTTPEGTSTGKAEFVCPSDSGYFTDPSDLNKFYQCGNGIAYSQTCPAGLQWNQDKLTCDWPRTLITN